MTDLGFHSISEARPLIKDILEHGGSAIIWVCNEYRMLMHTTTLHGPVTRLPWPLSRLQPHAYSLRVYQLVYKTGSIRIPAAGQLIRERHYMSRSQREEAIGDFLEGATAEDSVSIIAEK